MAYAKSFFDAGKPVAAIRHRGRRGSRWADGPSLKTDLKSAGTNWVDKERILDQKLVTSRKPDDIAAFNREMIRMFKAASTRRHAA